MRRLARLVFLLMMLAAVVTGSFYAYVKARGQSGAVPSALLAGIASIRPYRVNYAGEESHQVCLAAYGYVKKHTQVEWIENSNDSCYVSSRNTVYLTRESVTGDTIEAVHEYGHALDRWLHGAQNGYFSRQEGFANAYASDCAEIREKFRVEELFQTQAYRNRAVSDMLFAVFFEDPLVTQVLFVSYNASGVPYWHHEKEYLEKAENRRTEVFADIFTILLSNDTQAKAFLESWFPASTGQLVLAVEEKIQDLTL